jgi:hypothetical protein
MENTQNTAVAAGIDHAPMSELANYHQQIIEKYKSPSPAGITPNPDNAALTAFNGYYALNNAAGAFFAIDTNMLIRDGSPTPVYDVSLVVSLDGTSSGRFEFTGTFDGTSLKQASALLGGLDLDLTFAHSDGNDGTTATCSGNITFQSKTAPNVLGTTYNNPIPSSLFNGLYYGPIPLIPPGSTNAIIAPVMQINGYQVSYDNGINGGPLQPVRTYAYNMNMYYFSFTQGADTVRLIMGTAAAKGFACNNMVVDAKTNVNSRSLLTIPSPNQTKLVFPNLNSAALAAFSGYYQIPSVHPLAFVSIQAEYANVIGDDYTVAISVSLDGVTSKGYYFEEAQMTFANNVLTMPDQSISITFNRTYEPTQGSLTTITGSIGTQAISGNTLFNPVPLSVFGGVRMANAAGDSLTVVNNNEVIWNSLPNYKNVTMTGIIYVPLMYILAYPWDNPTIVMSFGTDGCKGNTCIVTDLSVKPPQISVVSAIPNP